jgi:hypothetical protein
MRVHLFGRFEEIRSLPAEGPFESQCGVHEVIKLTSKNTGNSIRHTYLFDLDIQVTTPIYSNHDIPSWSIPKCIPLALSCYTLNQHLHRN